MKKTIYLIFVSILLFSMAAGCGAQNGAEDVPGTSRPTQTYADENGQQGDSGEETPAQDTTKTEEADVNTIIDHMTLEEKAGQVFIMSPRNFEQYPEVTEFNDEVKKRIQNNHLGGVILFAENIYTIPQTKKLIEDLKASSGIPLFIAIDEEGGATSRINRSSEMHSTKFPSNFVIGKTGDTGLAEKVGAAIAQEISALGFNMNFAPIADVNTNPKNPVIGKRSFGDDPQLVSDMVKAEVKGMQSMGIIPVLKHFPGHGDTSTDTHTGAVTIEHDRERMDKIELYPFKKGIEDGAEAIMTAHIEVPKLTHDQMPATLSKSILTDLLRKQLNFQGLIITDALEMGAISQRWTSAEASILAFEAGADILLMPESIEEAYKGLLNAVKSGRIKEERLDQSLRRILELKKKRGLLEDSTNALDAEKILGSQEHLDLAKEVSAKGGKG